MNIIRKILMALAASLVLIVSIGWFLPSKRHLERSITIHAPSAAVFKEVNSLKRWEHWSPWLDVDPHTVVHHEGPEEGVGCTMSWVSENPKVGKGAQQIVVSEPNQHIALNVDFVDWDGTIAAGWKFEEKGENETLVTWSNDSDNRGKLLNKYMDLIIYPALGKSYEQGLGNLKAHVESLHAQQTVLEE